MLSYIWFWGWVLAQAKYLLRTPSVGSTSRFPFWNISHESCPYLPIPYNSLGSDQSRVIQSLEKRIMVLVRLFLKPSGAINSAISVGSARSASNGSGYLRKNSSRTRSTCLREVQFSIIQHTSVRHGCSWYISWSRLYGLLCTGLDGYKVSDEVLTVLNVR